MSELQLSLLGAGIAAVGAVWIYNAWQERKHRKAAEKIFKGDQSDVLLGGEPAAAPEQRIEPSAAPLEEEGDAVAAPPAAAETPAEAPAEATSAAAIGGSALPPEWADEIADCTLQLTFDAPVAAPALWAVQAAWAQQLTKPLTWIGFDYAARRWRLLNAHDAGRYTGFAASLQLADRQGPVSDSEVAIFFDGVSRLATQFSGRIELPPRHEVIAHAAVLDDFCASVDVQLGVAVVEPTGGQFAGSKLRGLAEAAGMVLKDDGRFHASGDDGLELYTLANNGRELFDADSIKTLVTHGITFTLDVPRVGDGAAVFDRMVAAARQMAEALGGNLVDAQRHALSDAMIDGIRAKVSELQQQMEKNHIAPGSRRALRLFS